MPKLSPGMAGVRAGMPGAVMRMYRADAFPNRLGCVPAGDRVRPGDKAVAVAAAKILLLRPGTGG